jgi:hypothetical protein
METPLMVRRGVMETPLMVRRGVMETPLRYTVDDTSVAINIQLPPSVAINIQLPPSVAINIQLPPSVAMRISRQADAPWITSLITACVLSRHTYNSLSMPATRARGSDPSVLVWYW